MLPKITKYSPNDIILQNIFLCTPIDSFKLLFYFRIDYCACMFVFESIVLVVF